MPTQRFSLLQIKGPDAEKFLQGQVTCDVTQVSSTKGSYGAHCTPKGRVLFSFFIFRHSNDCFWLQVLSSMADQALKDLKKYAVFFKLDLTNISEQFQIRLASNSSSLTEPPNSVSVDIQPFGNGFIRQRATDYWEIIGTPDQLPNENLQWLDENTWRLLDIRQGIAQVNPETRELLTPEDLNFPIIDAVNFRKGCYTGQEIVARMHYKGKHKRHTHLFSMESSDQLMPGTTIYNIKDQKIGELVECATVDSGSLWNCLCSIPDDEKNNCLAGQNKQKMRWLPLPYAIPEAEEQ